MLSDNDDKPSDSYMKANRSVRFTAAMRGRLKTAADRAGKRESDLVREAVARQLDIEEDALSAYDLAKKAGLIGVVRGTPPDLSTNRRHFDGFGEP
jgi:predicted DNA-binding protein